MAWRLAVVFVLTFRIHLRLQHLLHGRLRASLRRTNGVRRELPGAFIRRKQALPPSSTPTLACVSRLALLNATP